MESASSDGAREATRHIPSIGNHEDIAAHFREEDLRERYSMSNIPSVTVKHDNGGAS